MGSTVASSTLNVQTVQTVHFQMLRLFLLSLLVIRKTKTKQKNHRNKQTNKQTTMSENRISEGFLSS